MWYRCCSHGLTLMLELLWHINIMRHCLWKQQRKGFDIPPKPKGGAPTADLVLHSDDHRILKTRARQQLFHLDKHKNHQRCCSIISWMILLVIFLETMKFYYSIPFANFCRAQFMLCSWFEQDVATYSIENYMYEIDKNLKVFHEYISSFT